MSELELAAIVGMALVTYLTRVGGLLVTSQRTHFNGFTERFLKNLPAALLAALISPKLASGDPSIWLAALVTVVVVWVSRNTLLGVATGTVACALIRWLMG
ncbi:AzlD family protein [Pseudomonas vanderleydeniana]|uniref:AzlD domain-containing protein n=1 Tax=Pseudomonas vanderleydeniana TaxID=2745495 RepID=A0A9E6TRN9_9PSED|nr:AzlD domain-containing protein [Pseudomonas vanderleydeniana]QXI28064.1 AzlD domain-containing protein [Pseudomonas vanderleydeniana]